MWNTIINYILYAGLDKERYNLIRNGLLQENRKILQRMSIIAFLLFFALVVGAFFNATMMTRMWMYLGGAVLEAMIFLTARYSNNRPMVLYCMVYLFTLTLYAFGFAMDALTRTNESAVSFVVLLVICQLVFNDRPIRSGLMAMVMAAAFLVVINHTKAGTPEIVEDLLNVTSYVVAGFALNVLLMSARASNHLGMIEQQKQKEALQQALEVADIAAQSKSTFLFNMSHDIRTPMNAIIGYTDLMKKNTELTGKQEEYVDKIRVSSDYLLALLDNVLEMSRIENGKVTLDENPCDAVEFNDSLAVVFEEEIRRKNLHFEKTVQIDHRFVYCDAVKLQEIFLNVLSNSVKYTPEGGRITMQLEEIPSEREGYCVFKTIISDTGIGMSKEFLPHIFESFSRERTATESKVVGSGLGMGIVKNMVDLMGGTIEIHSELGKGTTTVICIPHPIGDVTEVKRSAADVVDMDDGVPMLAGRRILMAEDNDLNAEIAMEILEETGVKIDRAEDGIICVSMVEKAPPGTYDLILMDIQMPNMDGYKAARTIRGLMDPVKSRIPIVAMTANAFEKDRQDALSAGMDEHLTKPIDVPKLYTTLIRLMGTCHKPEL